MLCPPGSTASAAIGAQVACRWDDCSRCFGVRFREMQRFRKEVLLEFGLAYRRLVAATELQSLRVAQAVAGEFGDSLLTVEFVSDEHVDFICRLLLDPLMAKRPGLDELILALYIDREKLSESQLERFFGCLENSFGHLANENLALVTGDFLARVASPERALALLLDMTAKATSLQALAGVFLALDILRKHPAGMSLNAIESAVRTAEERSAQLKNEANSVQ
jgi:hypothetical protein